MLGGGFWGPASWVGIPFEIVDDGGGGHKAENQQKTTKNIQNTQKLRDPAPA